MKVGKEVTVTCYGGAKARRILVSVENGVFFVCKSEEYALATAEKREPLCIGFHPEDVDEST